MTDEVRAVLSETYDIDTVALRAFKRGTAHPVWHVDAAGGRWLGIAANLGGHRRSVSDGTDPPPNARHPTTLR